MTDLSFDDIDLVDLVRGDVSDGLERVFPAEAGFRVAEPFTEGGPALTSGSIGALAWEWEGRDSVGFQGLRPSERLVTVRGISLVEHTSDRDDPVLVRRYVDWLGVLGQLGLGLYSRPPRTDAP